MRGQEGHAPLSAHVTHRSLSEHAPLSGTPMPPNARTNRRALMRLSNALFDASYQGKTAVVRQLLEQRADVSAKDIDGSTALHTAAMRDHKGVVELLLEKKADVTATFKDGFTPLLLAAEKGHCSMCLLLLENRADVTAKTSDGTTPLLTGNASPPAY